MLSMKLPLPVVTAPTATHDTVRPNTSTLLPLAESDLIVVGYSGGKDSTAALLHILERCDTLGVPHSKVELWHQSVDGDPDSPNGLMDWPCTDSYCRAVASSLGLTLRRQWREGGIEREMLRSNARTAPMVFEMLDGSRHTAGGDRGTLNTRLKFPQVSGDLSVRWCSACAKIDVCSSAICHDPRLAAAKVLLVTGERREESANRARYAEVERHKATTCRRRVDQWRAVIDWSEAEVWSILRRHRVRPHPAYRLGWSRVSCAACIFSGPSEWASLRELDPARFARIAEYERRFGLTIKPGESVIEQANRGVSFVGGASPELRALALGRNYPVELVRVPEGEEWVLPAGAYRRGPGPS